MMQFVCYTNWSELPASSETLFTQATAKSVFFSRAWFETVSKHPLKDRQHQLFACVLDDDSLVAMLPLMSEDQQHWSSLGHLYTSLYSLLLTRDDPQIIDCLAQGLNDLSLASLRLAPIAEDDIPLQGLQQALTKNGFFCQRYFRFYNWSSNTHGQSYADYLAARPGQVRSTVTRKKRKLEREHQCTITLYTGSSSPAELKQGLQDYTQVYNASWKAHEQFNDFVYTLATNLAAQDWLRLAVLYIDEQPAAAQFWFVVQRKASIFKLAYDENWKQYSPGSILIAYLMQHVIDHDRVEEVDFLTGNDAYKMDWMTQRRVRSGLYCAKPLAQPRPEGLITRLRIKLAQWFAR